MARGISQSDIKEILQVHNQWRAKVANGLVTRGIPGPQPPAADMEQMVMNISFYIYYTCIKIEIATSLYFEWICKIH